MSAASAEQRFLKPTRTLSARERYRRHLLRVARGTAAKPRPRCTCQAYRFPHRPGSGNCRHPDPPAIPASRPYVPDLLRTGRIGARGIRRRILSVYGFHPIRDRARIVRFLPKLYVAWCRRYGHVDRFVDVIDYDFAPFPAMLIAANSRPTFRPESDWDWERAFRRARDRRTESDKYLSRSPARRRRKPRDLDWS
jgi:hypothetical protein